MPDREKLLTRIIKKTLAGKMTVEEAVDQLLCEMGRGGRTFVADEMCFGLVAILGDMGYNIHEVEPGKDDTAIKQRLWARVFITRNGRHFCAKEDLERYRYGLVWVTSTGDEKLVAQKIKRALTQAHFNSNLEQVVKV